MRRGTTPTYTIELGDFDMASIAEIVVTINQGYEYVNLRSDRVKVIGESVTFTLTQEETLQFRVGEPVQIQVRIRDKGGSAFASEISTDDVEPILLGEVI